MAHRRLSGWRPPGSSARLAEAIAAARARQAPPTGAASGSRLDPAPHGSRGHALHARDLERGEVPPVAQQDRAAGGLLELALHLGLLDELRGGRRAPARGRALLAALPTGVAVAELAGRVAHHAAQPGGEIAHLRRGPVEHREPGLLLHVLGPARVEDQAPRQAPHPPGLGQQGLGIAAPGGVAHDRDPGAAGALPVARYPGKRAR